MKPARKQAIVWARSLLAAGNFVILDTETTGLNRDRDDEPVAIAILAPNGSILLDTLVKPSIPVDPGAEAIHGIGATLLANAPTWAEIRTRVWEALEGKAVVIYNAGYDMPILENAEASCAEGYPAYVETIALSWQCAMERYAQFWGDFNDYHHSYRWQRLTAACAQQEIEVKSKPHSALGDCLRTLAVIRAMAATKLEDEVEAESAG